MTTTVEEQRRNIYIGIGLIFALVLATYFVYQIRAIVLVFLLTLLFSIIISGPVDYLQRKGVGRALGTLIVFGGLALVLVVAGYSMGSVVESQVQGLVESAPTFLSEAQDRIGELQSALGLESGLLPDPQQLFDSARNLISGGTFSTFVSVGASVANIFSFLVVILIATIFTVAWPAPLVNGFVVLWPAGRRERVREILGELYKTVQRWFLGQLTSMAMIGLLFTVALFLIGIPFALLLGILSGLLAFIPFVGPFISIIPPILLALAQDPILALWVLLAYAVVQFIEGNVIQPVVMSRAVSLHPTVIVFTLLIMGTLFGFVGLLLAIPLIAALQVLVRELWIERMDSLGTDPDPPKEEAKDASPETPKQRVGRLRRAAEALFRRS
ncbi:MAG: AI-2E family transporter [Actinobacteria bacterium]|nr:AI-2E family transporter [Actinomycetota bacterium]